MGVRTIGCKLAAAFLCLALLTPRIPAASAASSNGGTNVTGTPAAGLRPAPAAVSADELEQAGIQILGAQDLNLSTGEQSDPLPVAPAALADQAARDAPLELAAQERPAVTGELDVQPDHIYSAGGGGRVLEAVKTRTEAPGEAFADGAQEASGDGAPTRLGEVTAIAALPATPGAARGFDLHIERGDAAPAHYSFEAAIVGEEALGRRRQGLSAALKGAGPMPDEVAAEIAHKDEVLRDYRAAADAGAPRTMVIVNSISTEHDTGMVGEEDYCKRLMIILHKAASDPNLRIIYAVATMPDPALVRDHVLRHLPKAAVDELLGPERSPLGANLGRVKFVSLDDGARNEGGRRITFIEKFLLPRHAAKVAQLRALAEEHRGPAIIYSYLSTHGEAELARRIGIPDAVLGTQPDLLRELNSKSMGRKIAREAGVPILRGREDIDSLDKLVGGIHDLRRELGAMSQVYIKLNYGISGGGNWRFELPPGWADWPLARLREHLRGELSRKMVGPTSTYLDQLGLQGAVIEEDMTEEFEKAGFPSVQTGVLIQRDGSSEIEVYATHNQRVDEKGVFQGATSPADEDVRPKLIDYGRKITAAYARLGLRGEWSALDFAAVRPKGGGERRLIFMEPNHRLSGTTHLYLGLEALGGRMDPVDGKIRHKDGSLMSYASMDHRVNPTLKDGGREGLDPGVFIQYLNRPQNARVIDYYDQVHRVHITVFFYLLVIRQSGNIGYEVIAKGADKRVTEENVIAARNAAEVEVRRMLVSIDLSHVTNGAQPATFSRSGDGTLKSWFEHQAAFGATIPVDVTVFPHNNGGNLFPKAGSNGEYIRLQEELLRRFPELMFDPLSGQLDGVVLSPRGDGFSILTEDSDNLPIIHARLLAAAAEISK